MSFVAIDLTLFALFTLAVIVFLYKHKKNLKREGILYLYRTNIGLKIIDDTAKKYKKSLKYWEYVTIFSGIVLMIAIIYLMVKFSYSYLTSPILAKAIRVPVLLPLFPYVTNLFKIPFLPPFYFTYWVIIIAVAAIPHEFFHGIFAKFSKIKVHSTGFGFLGPFIAFFVEPDEKQMTKISRKKQMAILASGTFANVLTTILFAIIMWAFFSLAFTPAGVNFNTYALTEINTSQITQITNVSFGNITYGEILAGNETYFSSPDVSTYLQTNNVSNLYVYLNSPAFNAQLQGAITSIDEKPIRVYNDLNSTLPNYKPGDRVTITTIVDGNTKMYNITLGNNNGRAFLGVGVIPSQRSGFFGWFYNIISKIKAPEVYYQSKLGEFGIFVNDMLWWLVIICLSVALMNMLPVGIFDGGRFFMLAVWSVTGNKRAGEIAFKIATWFFLFLLVALMVKWAFAVF